ncbi:MAG: fused MFS/spermidine synthase [Flavobacteriaceae bacterium]|jgi:spermidine synthase|nr:fused MFS/spermidine synthase [Flavobacteriaceae bacterium]
MLKRLLSYISPITIKKIPSEVNKRLEITYNDGQLVLDTPNTNFSFGSLETVMRKGLKYIGYSKIEPMNNILILGLGGGSILKLLRKEVKYNGAITSVELDPAILFVAKKYFDLEQYSDKHTIVEGDAFEFMLKQKEHYDLIVIDIFQDYKMPIFLYESYFVDKVKDSLNINGFILFNTIALDKEDKDRNKQYVSLFESDKFSVRTHPKIQDLNELMTIKRFA